VAATIWNFLLRHYKFDREQSPVGIRGIPMTELYRAVHQQSEATVVTSHEFSSPVNGFVMTGFLGSIQGVGDRMRTRWVERGLLNMLLGLSLAVLI